MPPNPPAGELEAVINQAFPEVIAAVPQGPVTGDVLDTNPASDPQGPANPATSGAQQLTATSADNNQHQVIAQIHAEDKASQSAASATAVPGLTEMSVDDVQAVTESGVAPLPSLDTVRVDFVLGQQLSTLQLDRGLGSGSVPSTGNVPPAVTNQQGQINTAPPTPGAIAHTGNNLNAAPLSANSTQPGYESAAATFHGKLELPSALIPGAQPAGPEYEAEMPEDGNRQESTTMDCSNTQTDTSTPSTSANQQPGNLGATGQPVPAIRFSAEAIADLVKAAAAGNFWDIPGQMQGATAAQMQELHAVLQKMSSSQPSDETNPDKDGSEPEGGKTRASQPLESGSASERSSPDASSNSDMASDTDSQEDTTRRRKRRTKKGSPVAGVKDLFTQAEDDVIVLSGESGDECGFNVDQESCPNWATQIEEEAKPDWAVRYPIANPFVHSRVERTEDGWYRGEDCANPLEAAPPAKHAILPAADGSLALKDDAVLPGAPSGRDKFGARLLERVVFHQKAEREDHKVLDPIPPAELEKRA